MTAPCTPVAPKPPAAQLTFRRTEAKYLLGLAQREELLRLMASRMMPDEHGPSTVRNVYHDTPTALLARRSAEKPDSAPKCHGYRGYGSNLLPYPGFCGGARRSRGSLASPNVSRPFLVRVGPASGEKRPRFGRVASWSRFFAALRTPRRLLPDNVLRGVP